MRNQSLVPLMVSRCSLNHAACLVSLQEPLNGKHARAPDLVLVKVRVEEEEALLPVILEHLQWKDLPWKNLPCQCVRIQLHLVHSPKVTFENLQWKDLPRNNLLCECLGIQLHLVHSPNVAATVLQPQLSSSGLEVNTWASTPAGASQS